MAKVRIKLIYCLRRLPHLSLEEFQAHWLEHHSQYGRRSKLIRRYVQNHTLLEKDTASLEALGTVPDAWDGVTTAYFESVAKLKALVASPLAAEEAFEDERTFIDHSQSVSVLTRRHVIRDVVR